MLYGSMQSSQNKGKLVFKHKNITSNQEIILSVVMSYITTSSGHWDKQVNIFNYVYKKADDSCIMHTTHSVLNTLLSHVYHI